MTALSAQDIFGKDVTQDVTNLYIHKANLPIMSPSSMKPAQILLAGIILHLWQAYSGFLTDENNNPVTDEKGAPITYDQSGYWDYPLFEYGALLLNKTNVNTAVLINKYTPYIPS